MSNAARKQIEERAAAELAEAPEWDANLSDDFPEFAELIRETQRRALNQGRHETAPITAQLIRTASGAFNASSAKGITQLSPSEVANLDDAALDVSQSLTRCCLSSRTRFAACMQALASSGGGRSACSSRPRY